MPDEINSESYVRIHPRDLQAIEDRVRVVSAEELAKSMASHKEDHHGPVNARLKSLESRQWHIFGLATLAVAIYEGIKHMVSGR